LISFRILVLCLLLAVTSLGVAGYGFLSAESCFGVAAATGQCSQITDFVVEWLGIAGLNVSSYILHWGVKQRWKALAHKRPVLVLTSLGVVAGGVVAYAAYYVAKVAGLVIADYATCGGYSVPPGCFTFNPFVLDWFIITGCFSGFEALLILAVKRGIIRAESIPSKA
jgi:hypothetical protein